MEEIEFESTFPTEQFVFPITSQEKNDKIDKVIESLILIDPIYESENIKSQILNIRNIPQFFFSNSKMLAISYHYINNVDHERKTIPDNFKDITYDWLSRVFKTSTIEEKYYIDLIRYIVVIKSLLYK